MTPLFFGVAKKVFQNVNIEAAEGRAGVLVVTPEAVWRLHAGLEGSLKGDSLMIPLQFLVLYSQNCHPQASISQTLLPRKEFGHSFG